MQQSPSERSPALINRPFPGGNWHVAVYPGLGELGGGPCIGTVIAMSSDRMELTVTPLAPPTDVRPPRIGAAPLRWTMVILVTLVGAALRLIDLGRPQTEVFDEIYYATAGRD